MLEERGQQKHKRPGAEHVGHLCRFCEIDLKQGPNSPHIHTGFPEKYVQCPAKVFSIHQPQDIQKEKTWKEFQESGKTEMGGRNINDILLPLGNI